MPQADTLLPQVSRQQRGLCPRHSLKSNPNRLVYFPISVSLSLSFFLSLSTAPHFSVTILPGYLVTIVIISPSQMVELVYGNDERDPIVFSAKNAHSFTSNELIEIVSHAQQGTNRASSWPTIHL